MARRTVEHRRTTSYRTEVQGNTVRKIQEVPGRSSHARGLAAAPRRERKPERTTLSIPYCVFLTAACVVTLFLGSYYLQQQALSTNSQKKIASLESTLADMKKDNADDLNRIETSVNLDEIRDIAINDLGMVYATQENVVVYKNTTQNYVSQYEELPEEEESLIKSIVKSK